MLQSSKDRARLFRFDLSREFRLSPVPMPAVLTTRGAAAVKIYATGKSDLGRPVAESVATIRTSLTTISTMVYAVIDPQGIGRSTLGDYRATEPVPPRDLS